MSDGFTSRKRPNSKQKTGKNTGRAAIGQLSGQKWQLLSSPCWWEFRVRERERETEGKILQPPRTVTTLTNSHSKGSAHVSTGITGLQRLLTHYTASFLRLDHFLLSHFFLTNPFMINILHHNRNTSKTSDSFSVPEYFGIWQPWSWRFYWQWSEKSVALWTGHFSRYCKVIYA